MKRSDSSLHQLVGQDDLKARLQQELASRSSQAFILRGPPGIGKTTFARAFAKALLCEAPAAGSSCNRCSACRHFEGGVHPDYQELAAGADSVIKVERIRRQVTGELALQPQLGKRKIWLIEGDELNEQGQNALLKSLEEPPEYAVFILTASTPEVLLPTIRSRAVTLVLRRSSAAEIRQILETREPGVSEHLDFLVHFSLGLPGRALELAADTLFPGLRTDTLRLYQNLYTCDRLTLLTEQAAFFDSNKDRVVDVLDILQSLVRDQLVWLQTGREEWMINRDFKPVFLKLAKDAPHVTPNSLARCSEQLIRTAGALSHHASYEGLIAQLLISLRKELNHGKSNQRTSARPRQTVSF